MEKKEQSITERFLRDYLIKLCWQEKEVDMLIDRFLVVQEIELYKAREEGKREKYDMFPKDLSEHFYFGELRHNSMCKFCTEAQDIIQSEEYKDKVKEILKQLYNEKILSNLKTKE